MYTVSTTKAVFTLIGRNLACCRRCTEEAPQWDVSVQAAGASRLEHMAGGLKTVPAQCVRRGTLRPAGAIETPFWPFVYFFCHESHENVFFNLSCIVSGFRLHVERLGLLDC